MSDQAARPSEQAPQSTEQGVIEKRGYTPSAGQIDAQNFSNLPAGPAPGVAPPVGSAGADSPAAGTSGDATAAGSVGSGSE